jgi:hypothetical protein
MMASRAEQLRMNLSDTELTQTVEKKGDYVITRGATIYLDRRKQICWIASGTAYCERLNKNRESAVVLKESLRVYRDSQYKIIPTDQRIWVACQGLVKS